MGTSVLLLLLARCPLFLFGQRTTGYCWCVVQRWTSGRARGTLPPAHTLHKGHKVWGRFQVRISTCFLTAKDSHSLQRDIQRKLSSLLKASKQTCVHLPPPSRPNAARDPPTTLPTFRPTATPLSPRTTEPATTTPTPTPTQPPNPSPTAPSTTTQRDPASAAVLGRSSAFLHPQLHKLIEIFYKDLLPLRPNEPELVHRVPAWWTSQVRTLLCVLMEGHCFTS